MSSKTLIKNTTIYALGDIAPKLLGFISFPIFTRYLSPEEYGIVNYINTFTTFLLAVGLLGINTYFLVYYYKCETEEEKRKLFGNLFLFIILFNVILVGIFIFLGDFMFKELGSNISFFPYILIGVLTHFFNLFSIFPSALFRLLEKPVLLTVLNVTRGFLVFAIGLILVVIFHFSVLGILYSGLVVNFIFALIFLYVSRNQIQWNINWVQLRGALKFSLPLLPGTLAYFITTISDRLLIDKYLNLSDLGIYSTAATLALVLNVFAYGAYKAFEPFIFKVWDTEDFKRKLGNLQVNYLYVLLIGVLFLSIYSKEFFRILSDSRFHLAYWYVPIIIVGVFSASLSMFYGTLITAQAKTKISSLINITGALLSIVLNIIFLPKFGLIVAALVSSFAMTFMLMMSVWYSGFRLNFTRSFISIVFVFTAIYFLVYQVVFEDLLISILIKFVAAILVLYTLSFTLKVNPLAMVKDLTKTH